MAALLSLALLVATAASLVEAPASGATPATAAVRLGRPPRLPAGSQAGAPLPASAPLDLDVVLTPRDPAGLAALARAVTTPGNPLDGRFLRPGQFAARFGATAATVRSVDAALRRAGLHPGPVSANRLSLPVRATAADVARAFATGFRQYRLRAGRTVYANTAAPLVPAEVAPDIQTVVGLDSLAVPSPTSRPAPPSSSPPATAGRRRHPSGDGGPQPCSTAVQDGASAGAETTDQVASAYRFPSLYGQGDLGAGATVALYELQGFGTKDIAAYQSCYGTSASVTTVNVDGGPAAHSGVGEADVDIEQVAGLSPEAAILVYQGPNTSAGGYDTYSAIVSDDRAPVVSTSWGLCEPAEGSNAAVAESVLFEQAAAQGQGIFAASGDQGSEDCVTAGSGDSLAVDDPASQPFVTGVGGTSWSSAGTPPDETAWNDGPTCCWGAGGGGISSLWSMPGYQVTSTVAGVHSTYSSGTPCAATGGSECREVPDVAALSGPFPYLEFVNGHWGAWGGTSLAAPLWAALTALSDASSACTGRDIGFADPALYQVAAGDPAAFQDVTTGDNDLTGNNGGLYPAGTGYDMATGLGTPDAGRLATDLCAATAPSPVTVTNPGNQSSPVGATVSLQVSANDTTPGQTLTYRANGLPDGLSIDAGSGLITGQPTTAGTTPVTVTARDGNGASGSASFDWTVADTITSPDQATATIGQPFTFTFTATGSPSKLTVTGTRPKGIVRHQSGGTASLSGTPSSKSAPGDYPLEVTATYGTHKSSTTVTQSFTLMLQAAG
jgi:subtilase family serine protease